jgi:YegS/Rv2252/BmrU family lipid kinase
VDAGTRLGASVAFRPVPRARVVSLIVNPSAGGGRAETVLPEVTAALDRHGIKHHVERTRSLEHARELAKAATKAGEMSVTLGGDGLVGCVAGALSGTGGVLGVLPGGRGNDFARSLGVPLEIGPACDLVAEGRERRVDIGDVDGRPFIGIASCGFDSEANRVANETKLVKGDLVYAYGALRTLASWKPATFTVDCDGGERWTYAGFSVAAANANAFGGGMFLAPDAELDDGEIDVVMIGGKSKRRYLAGLPDVFDGSHVKNPLVKVRRTASVRVAADRPFTMYADGDPIADLPCTVTTRHLALRVMAPEPE